MNDNFVKTNIDDLKCESPVQEFPYFRPNNQLPFPAAAGMLLVTKSDFTLPARPDLLEWKTIESVIGVSDITLTISEDGLTATLYKTVDNQVIPIGSIGVISPENAQKLNAIDYVYYYITADTDNHILTLYGTDKDGQTTEISQISYVSYNEFNTEKENTNTRFTNVNNEINNIKTRLDTDETNIATNTTNITNNTSDIADIKTRLNTDETNIATNTTNITNNTTQITNLITDVTAIESDISNNIKPIINRIIAATNPFLVLRKASDGVTIEWANILALSDVTAVIDTPNHIIKLYKNINGVESLVCNITDIDYATFDNVKNKVLQISNNLDEASTAGYVLTKIDATHYDWREIDLSDYYTKYETDNFLEEKLSKNDIILLTMQEYNDLPIHPEDKFYFIIDRI